jgi:hypothetical protein
MKKVNVRVTGAVVNGQPDGSTLEIDERSAAHLASIGYVEILPASKAVGEKGESAPKKPSARKRKNKDNDDK